jgi:(2Fe-2S) ferredoxin
MTEPLLIHALPPSIPKNRYPRLPAMQSVRLLPIAHLFVCTNRREHGSPLGPGCSGKGDAVYEALKVEVALRSLVRSVWVTRTHCLGICPKDGATVAVYPEMRMWVEATETDAGTLLDRAVERKQ